MNRYNGDLRLSLPPYDWSISMLLSIGSGITIRHSVKSLGVGDNWREILKKMILNMAKQIWCHNYKQKSEQDNVHTGLVTIYYNTTTCVHTHVCVCAFVHACVRVCVSQWQWDCDKSELNTNNSTTHLHSDCSSSRHCRCCTLQRNANLKKLMCWW